MRSRWMACTAVFALALTAFAGDGSVKSQLQKNYDAMSAAMMRLDLPAVMKFIAPDFVGVHEGTTYTREQMEKQMAGYFKMTKKVEAMSYRILSLKMHGGKAVVMLAGTGKMQMADPMGKDKKLHVMTVKSIDKETWSQHGKQWLCSRSENQKMTMTMDGKPMPMGAPPKKKK